MKKGALVFDSDDPAHPPAPSRFLSEISAVIKRGVGEPDRVIVCKGGKAIAVAEVGVGDDDIVSRRVAYQFPVSKIEIDIILYEIKMAERRMANR